MKAYYLIASCALSFITYQSCQNADACVDLNSGETIRVIKDETTGQMVDAKTGKPVILYVEKRTQDTIYGPTGEVVNNKITKTSEGQYVYAVADLDIRSEGDEYKIKGEDYKMKVEEDGDIKIKDGDSKTKIDGETGERKVK